MRAVRALVAACALVVASTAHADPENAVGLGPEAAARASAVGALPIGAPAVHYNPAALALAEDGTTELELALVRTQPFLFADRSGGGDLDLASDAEPTTALFAGTRFDLGSAIDLPGLHVALALLTPLGHVFRYETHPDDAPQWLMWGDRMQHIVVWLGLGYRIADFLSIGVAARVMFDIELFTTGRVRGVTRTTDPATGEEAVVADTELGEELRVIGHAAPIVGAIVTPAAGVRAGLVWRGAIRLDDWGWARVAGETGGLGALGYVYRFSHYYRPHELALSAAWEPSRELSLSAELTWQMWSRAVGGTFDELPGRFGDTLVPAVSGRVSVAPGVSVMGGYRYVRSPFDNLGGPTNLLDNDRHEPSVGASWMPEGSPITVSLAVRVAVLVARDETKDWQRFESDADLERNPGYPGYSHGGVVPSAQLGAEAAW